MQSNPALYPEEVYSATPFFGSLSSKDSYYRHFEVGLLHWLSNDGQATVSQDFTKFSGLLGGIADSTHASSSDGDLEYAGIRSNSIAN